MSDISVPPKAVEAAYLYHRKRATKAYLRGLIGAAMPMIIAGQWVACSERMPERGRNVLVTELYPHMREVDVATTAWHTGEQWMFLADPSYEITPTHWMPLPDPPEVKP